MRQRTEARHQNKASYRFWAWFPKDEADYVARRGTVKYSAASGRGAQFPSHSRPSVQQLKMHNMLYYYTHSIASIQCGSWGPKKSDLIIGEARHWLFVIIKLDFYLSFSWPAIWQLFHSTTLHAMATVILQAVCWHLNCTSFLVFSTLHNNGPTGQNYCIIFVVGSMVWSCFINNNYSR